MKHVAVLMGGWSAEREISLRSGKACADALERVGLSGEPDRCRSRRRRDSARAQTGCRAQCSSRPSGRRRHIAGAARGSRHSLQPFRCARLGAGDEERHRKERAQVRGRAGAGRNGGRAQGSGEAALAAAALRDQAGGGRVERRRFHRARGPRASAAGTDACRLGVRRQWFSSSLIFPARSSPAR